MLSPNAAVGLTNRGELKGAVCTTLACAVGCSEAADFGAPSLRDPSGAKCGRTQIIVGTALRSWWASYLFNCKGAICVFATSSQQVSVVWMIPIIQLITDTDVQHS